MYHPIIVLPSSTNCYVFLRKLGLVKVNGHKEQIMVLPVQGLCRCHRSRAPSSPKEPQPMMSWTTFSWFMYTYQKIQQEMRKCQSLHLIKTWRIWPLRGTSVLSPANCLRYKVRERLGVPAKHVFLKQKNHFSGIWGFVWKIPKGLFILTSFRGAISLIWCKTYLDPSPAQFTTRSHFPWSEFHVACFLEMSRSLIFRMKYLKAF